MAREMLSPSIPPGRRVLLGAAMAGLAAYLAGLLWYSRFHMLDDALIHLRYAELLLEHGFFTSDGSARNFGASSPVFVLLAAAVHGLVETDFTTKFLSIVFYLALVCGLVVLTARASGPARVGWLILSVLVISPIGVRWLTDGMETSLVAGMALLLGIAAAGDGSRGAASAAALALLGAIAVTTRIGLALLVALAAACIALRPHGERQAHLLLAIALAAGGLAGLLTIWLCFGALLPDAAIAKTAGMAAPAISLLAIAISLAGGLVFGAGLLVLWLAGLSANLVRGRIPLAALAAPNLALIALWALIAARGQYVQGIRHVLPALVFMIAANITFLAATDFPALLRKVDDTQRRRAAWAAAAMVAVAFALEFLKFQPIVENRTAAFLSMRALNLAALEGRNGIGWDVGHLMYFTKGHVCDVNGLINGRAAAATPEPSRLDNCLRREVEFVFVTRENAADLIDRSGTRFADWPVCGRYLFQNVSTTEPHYLAVSPARAQQICPQGRAPELLKRAALDAS
jgi:hypothetical protein